jgi:hypothetical protein
MTLPQGSEEGLPVQATSHKPGGTMAKYLILREEHIEISTDHVGLNQRSYHPVLFGGAIPVWHRRGYRTRVPHEAAIFADRVAMGPYVKEIDTLISRLRQRFGDSAGYIAVGASPKLVKWEMKARHLPVCALNVSRGLHGFDPTADFEAYLKRKLDKLGPRSTYVVMDFVNTGTTLQHIRGIVRRMRPTADVFMAAIGTARDGCANVADFRSAPPNLSQGLFDRATKHFLGRHKPRNHLDSWSAEQNRTSATCSRGSGPGRRSVIQHTSFFEGPPISEPPSPSSRHLVRGSQGAHQVARTSSPVVTAATQTGFACPEGKETTGQHFSVQARSRHGLVSGHQGCRDLGKIIPVGERTPAPHLRRGAGTDTVGRLNAFHRVEDGSATVKKDVEQLKSQLLRHREAFVVIGH